MTHTTGFISPLTAATLLAASPANAQADAPDLARHFGFDPVRIVAVDPDAGPMAVADFDDDGLLDFAVVNNRKSRIELHLQRPEPIDDAERLVGLSPNELPPSRWYERRNVSVSHRVTALAAHDMTGDGRIDLVYTGRPGELVVLSRDERGEFDTLTRKRIRGLSTNALSLTLADALDTDGVDAVVIASGRIQIFPFDGEVFGEPTTLGAGASDEQLVSVISEDVDGDGLADIIAVTPDHPAPLRIWRQRRTPSGAREIGAELRFDMPAIRHVNTVRFPDRDAASILVIERATRRLVVYDLIDPHDGSETLAREARAMRRAWDSGAQRDRAVVVADIDGDGAPDIIAADPAGNALLLHRQRPGQGVGRAVRSPTLRQPAGLSVGAWDDPDRRDVFVLSEEEQAVGVSRYDARTQRLSFPSPIRLATAGGAPVAMTHMELADGPALAVVVRHRRDHILEIHRPGADDAHTVRLDAVRRSPGAVLAADIDGDGAPDLMILTPGEPMTLVLADDSGMPARALASDRMPQFGLVQNAGPANTALMDVTGDGRTELLIADANYVRACAYDADRGWRVVEQINAPDPQSRFVGLTVFDRPTSQRWFDASSPVIVAADAGGRALALIAPDPDDGVWSIVHRVELPSDEPAQVHAGAFSGDDRPDVLIIDAGGFGVARLIGGAPELDAAVTHRSDNENRLEHTTAVGDVNSDGYTDLVVLDARERMCQIFTFSASRRLHAATEFKVFETRQFQGSDGSRFEPSSASIADVTGDGADDIILLAHDRVLIYPQMTTPGRE